MGVADRLRAQWRGGPLSDRNFRLLTAGQFTSTVGDFCYAVALPWLVLSTMVGRSAWAPCSLAMACRARCSCRSAACSPTSWGRARSCSPPIWSAAGSSWCWRCSPRKAHRVAGGARPDPAALLGAGEGLFIPASFTIMPSLLGGGLAAGRGRAQLRRRAVRLAARACPRPGILVASALLGARLSRSTLRHSVFRHRRWR